MEIGTAVVHAMDQRDLYRLLYMQDAAVEDEVIWRINNCLDFIAAGNFVRAFEHAAQLGPLSEDALGTLIDRVVDRLKGENPVGPQTCRWPPPEDIAAMAAAEVARVRPSGAEELEAAILPLIQPDYLANPLGGEDPSQHPPTGPDGERRAWKASFIDL